MNSAWVDQCRAHLLVASLAAVLVQAMVLGAMLVFDAPETFFTSDTFRLGVVVVVAAAVILSRTFAGSAFRSALAGKHVCFGDGRQDDVALSSHCPKRALVALHVRLNRRKLGSTAS